MDEPQKKNDIIAPKLSQNAQKLKDLEDRMTSFEVNLHNQGYFERNKI